MTAGLHPARTASVSERFRARARATPDAVAVETADSTLDYAGLDQRVDTLAAVLAATGAGPEHVVAVALSRGTDLPAAVLATDRVGAAYLPIDPDLPAERIAYMLGNARPTALVHDRTTSWIADLGGAVPRVAMERVGRGTAARPGRTGSGRVCGETPLYLMYTSGSTGRPKGVVMPSAGIENLLDWHLDELRTGPGRRVAQFTAIGFDISAQEVLSTLVSGATLVVPGDDTRRDPRRLVRWLDRHRITDLFAPNVVVEAVCREALAAGLVLPDLAHVAQAGEQLTLGEDVRTFFRLRPGRTLHNHYGPTETHAATGHVLPASPDDWPGRAPVGTAVHRTAVRLLDAELAEVPPGAVGEVFVTGRALARGYQGRPDLTAERFLPATSGPPGGRMYRTGDLARQLDDGALEYLGRADDQVKIRGVRVEPAEVETALRACADVADAAVVACGTGADTRLEAHVVAVGAPRAGLVEELRTRLAAVLHPAMVPASISLLPALPTNANGKVDRSALTPAPAGSDAPADAALPDGAPPATVETDRRVLARLVAECLDVDVVADDADLFRLGLHSLSAARIAARVRDELGREVTAADVFRNADLQRLTAALTGADDGLPPLRRRPPGSRPCASFSQERLWILDQFAGPDPAYNVPLAIGLSGPLDHAALVAAVGDLVERHEPLRSVVDGDATGLFLAPVAGPPVVSRVELPADEVPAAVAAAARVPFDLAAEPPVRAQLFGSGTEHVLLLLVHHVAVDGWSVGAVTRDLGFAYTARLAGTAPPWRPLPLRFSDHAVRQREVFGGDPPAPAAEPLRRFWARQLAGAAGLTGLRTDLPRPEVLSSAGDRVPVLVPPDVHALVRDAARRSGTTVFMLVHTALTVLLQRRGAGDDVVVGAAVAGRADGLLDDLVGFFVNTVALRVDLTGEPDLAEVLARVRDTVIAALHHQELPFDRVVEVVNPPRSMAYAPLVQVVLAFQVDRPAAPRMPGLRTSVEVLGTGTAKFDLTVELAEDLGAGGAPAGIVGHLEYSTDLFHRSTAQAVADELVELLTQLAALRPASPAPPTPRAPDHG